MGTKQEVAFMRHNEIFKRLAQVSNVATLTPEERYSYDADVKNARDALNQIRYAFKEGRAEGHAKGRAEGRAEMLSGMALKMIQQGLDNDFIEGITGLTAEQINELRIKQ